ncbi:hypothetical protein TNCV_1344751 [Trichonephila clavipes]|nr:hypothetical protein TNCV_1344751 [Trichonephila clavipes]
MTFNHDLVKDIKSHAGNSLLLFFPSFPTIFLFDSKVAKDGRGNLSEPPLMIIPFPHEGRDSILLLSHGNKNAICHPSEQRDGKSENSAPSIPEDISKIDMFSNPLSSANRT